MDENNILTPPSIQLQIRRYPESKIFTVTILSIIVTALLSFWLRQTTGANPPVHDAPVPFSSLPIAVFDPLSTCICTVTGTIDTDAATETGLR